MNLRHLIITASLIFIVIYFSYQSSSVPPLNAINILETDQDPFIDELARDTFNYLSSDWATTNHLPWSWRSETLTGGDFVNTTEIGLYLLSWLGAYEMQRSWSPQWLEVENELTAVLDQLEDWQTPNNGELYSLDAYLNSVFYQWYWISWNPPKVGDGVNNHLVPSIDNAFLAASLITIKEYGMANGHPDLATKANAILEDMDFRIWYDYGRHQFNLGSSDAPLAGVWADYYSNENRIINFVARALNQLTPDEFRASLAALEQPIGIYDRFTTQEDDDIVIHKVAWDGSYFTYLAPALFIKEHNTVYGSHTINPVTEAQIAYAEDKGYSVWGLSDVYDINDGEYIQQGALPTASPDLPEVHSGVIAPHASAMALITPYASSAISNMQTLSTTFPLLYPANYGFLDSVMANPNDPQYENVSNRYTAIAQGWLFISIVNHETGFVWDYFYLNEGVKQAHQEMYPSISLPIILVPPG